MARAKISDDASDPRTLWAAARGALGLSGTDLADVLNVSRKTVSRITAGHSPPDPSALAKLAPLVHPRDAALAERMHAYATAYLTRLHLAPPPPLPGAASAPAPREASPEPPPPLASAKVRVQALLLVATEAMDASPRAVRKGLLAAFRYARELGLSFEAIEHELAQGATVTKPESPAPAPAD